MGLYDIGQVPPIKYIQSGSTGDKIYDILLKSINPITFEEINNLLGPGSEGQETRKKVLEDLIQREIVLEVSGKYVLTESRKTYAQAVAGHPALPSSTSVNAKPSIRRCSSTVNGFIAKAFEEKALAEKRSRNTLSSSSVDQQSVSQKRTREPTEKYDPRGAVRRRQKDDDQRRQRESEIVSSPVSFPDSSATNNSWTNNSVSDKVDQRMGPEVVSDPVSEKGASAKEGGAASMPEGATSAADDSLADQKDKVYAKIIEVLRKGNKKAAAIAMETGLGTTEASVNKYLHDLRSLGWIQKTKKKKDPVWSLVSGMPVNADQGHSDGEAKGKCSRGQNDSCIIMHFTNIYKDCNIQIGNNNCMNICSPGSPGKQ